MLGSYLSQSFRKDIWVKGAINLTVKEKAEALSQIFICENNPPNICDYEIKGNLGSVLWIRKFMNP